MWIRALNSLIWLDDLSLKRWQPLEIASVFCSGSNSICSARQQIKMVDQKGGLPGMYLKEPKCANDVQFGQINEILASWVQGGRNRRPISREINLYLAVLFNHSVSGSESY